MSSSASDIIAELLRPWRVPVFLFAGQAWESTYALTRMFDDDAEGSRSTIHSVPGLRPPIPPKPVRLLLFLTVSMI